MIISRSSPTHKPYSFTGGADELNLSSGFEKRLDQRPARVDATSVFSNFSGGVVKSLKPDWPDRRVRTEKASSELIAGVGTAKSRPDRTERIERIEAGLPVVVVVEILEVKESRSDSTGREAGLLLAVPVVWTVSTVSWLGRADREVVIRAGLPVPTAIVMELVREGLFRTLFDGTAR